jgi:hypothetical protein
VSRTGRLADELSRQPNRNKLITVPPAHGEARIVEVVHAALLENHLKIQDKAEVDADLLEPTAHKLHSMK